jgi:hypothetical protein
MLPHVEVSRRRVRYGALALIATLAGCSGGTVDPALDDAAAPQIAAPATACEGPAQSLPAALAAQLPGSGGFRTSDDVLADLSRRAPGGFAGIYYDTPTTASANGRPVTGPPVLLLTDPSRAAAAKAALAPALPHFDIAGAQVRQARWTFAQLHDWYRYLGQQGSIWTGSNVTVSDINEVANRIEIGVADDSARRALTDRLAAMALPCGLVHVIIVPPATTRPGA